MSEASTSTQPATSAESDAEETSVSAAPGEEAGGSVEAVEPVTAAAQEAAEASQDAAAGDTPEEGGRADAGGSGDGEAADVAAKDTGEDTGEDTEGAEDSQVARLEREGEVAADFREQLLDIADLDGDLDVDVDGDRAAVAIIDSEEGRVPRRLVGDQAKVLEALQELTRLAVQAETGERSRLMLDVAGYRADRRKALVETARAAVAEGRSTGERKMLEPMTAFERKVVHDEVLAEGLTSESEGVEPERRVVVLPH